MKKLFYGLWWALAYFYDMYINAYRAGTKIQTNPYDDDAIGKKLVILELEGQSMDVVPPIEVPDKDDLN